MSHETDDADATQAIDAYLTSSHELWPDAQQPRLHHTRGTSDHADESALDLLVLPRSSHPRLLVPAGNRPAAARAMFRFSAALSVREIVQRLGVAALLRTAGGQAFPDRIRVRESPASLRSHLGDILGQPVDVSLGLGTARVNRKPVLQVFDRRGRSIAFAKLGESSSTRALVRGEAASLRHLESAGLPPGLEVPRLLHDGEWRGHSLLVMSALPNSVRQRPSHQFQVPHDSMRALHQAFAGETCSVTDTPFWERLLQQVDALGSAPGADRLRDAVARLETTARQQTTTPGAWHGDWTPWNMSRRRGRVQLWDWERFETGVPEGLDACHYGVNAICRRDGFSVASVLAGLRLAVEDAPRGLGIAPSLYLAAIGSRYLAGTLDARGRAIAPASRVVLDVLEAHVAEQHTQGEP
ncbi:phosphotransferase [Nocardioides aequoreus]|uniref:phosphotransferase n=1 Tax=Nocardioides aequoreus TaxID=397278 RepID=UPI0006921AA7|nr:phosphotransferase [Nocardioides aequoreus]